MICRRCDGDGGWERAYGVSRVDGGLLCDWVQCDHCEGIGAVDGCDEEPRTLDDLEDEDAAIAASEG